MSTPSAVALKHIILATCATLESSDCLELFHIFPASAKRVMAIMRMDQISGSESSRPSRSRKSAGSTRRKRAEKPKTIEPALRVLRRCGWFICRA